MVDTPVWLLVLDGANKAVASAAFLVGGIWAYYKFIRGRVYRPRLEPTIAVRAFQRTAHDYLVASISLKNVGTSKVEIKQEGSALRVFCTPLRVEAPPQVTEWKRVATLPVFEAHAWIESTETIEDTPLIYLPPEQLAAKLELRIVGQALEWNAKAIVQLGVDAGMTTR
jgi:hypothetical protein